MEDAKTVEDNAQEKEVNSNQEQEQNQKQEVDPNELAAKLEKLEQSNKRLLDESYQYKQKYNGLKSEIEQKQKQSLEEQENFKELYELEKQKSMEASSKAEKLKRQALQKDMHFKVASKATDAYDVSDIIKSLPRDLLEIDEETESVSGIEEAIKHVRESKPYLFKKNNGTGFADRRPQGDNGKRSWEDLEGREKDKLFADSLNEWIN